jgi:hypothetical protein
LLNLLMHTEHPLSQRKAMDFRSKAFGCPLMDSSLFATG